MTETILVIDDDTKLNDLLKTFLSDFGYTVVTAEHPETGLDYIQQYQPDLIILDVMLPAINGFDLCRTIREKSRIPVIMLTARGDLMDRVVGLELGADDYLSKPFEPRELVARIKSVLRRYGILRLSEKKQFGSLSIDYKSHAVNLGTASIELTNGEFEALKLLTENPGVVLDRDAILNRLKGVDCDAYNRTVDITMSRLRNKLGDNPKKPEYIKTVWGAGYMFIGRH